MNILHEVFTTLTHSELENEFIMACRRNDIDSIRFILTSKELEQNVDIHYNNDEGLISAAYEGKIEAVKYLLTSPELTEHANINASNDEAFILACSAGNFDIIKYLLSSPELKKHANLRAQDDKAFLLAYESDRYDILRYFILDLNIPFSLNIKEFIFMSPDSEVESMFELRKLNKKLAKDLRNKPFKANETKKPKI